MALTIGLSVLALGTPLILAWHVGRRAGLRFPEGVVLLAIGGAGWLLAKIPKALVVIPTFLVGGLPLQMSADDLAQAMRVNLWLLPVLAMTAAVFEELGKPAGLWLRRGKIDASKAYAAGWITGLGAGTLEALNFLVQGFFQAGSLEALALVIPLERLLIALYHGALTAVFVHYAFRNAWRTGLAIAASNHFLIDLVLPALQVHGVLEPGWMMEVLTAAWVAATVAITVVSTSRTRRPEPGPGTGRDRPARP